MTNVSILGGAWLTSTLVRVRDLSASVEWFATRLGLSPISTVDDGSNRFASYIIAKSVVSLWELPDGVERRRNDEDTNTYIAWVTNDDLSELRHRLVDLGVEVSDLRGGGGHSFFWFYDPDGNRYEITQPATDSSSEQAAKVWELVETS